MANGFFSSRGSGVVLFDEDFDLPPPSASDEEPEVIEPLYTLAELKAAREEAAREGREAAHSEMDGSATTAANQTLASIAEQLALARSEAISMVEQSSEAIARLLLTCFAAAFPALSARHGAGEAAALVREILPALQHEPKISVRVNPHVAVAISQEIQAFDADLAARVRLVPTDALAPGDARLTWESGAAARDTELLWTQIENILAPAGLLNT